MDITLPENLRYNDSSVYSGSTSGESARKELNLDALDKNGEKVIIRIPNGTSYIDNAFINGLLGPSIKKFGIGDLNKKYSFVSLDENDTVKEVLNESVNKGLERLNRSIR